MKSASLGWLPGDVSWLPKNGIDQDPSGTDQKRELSMLGWQVLESVILPPFRKAGGIRFRAVAEKLEI